MCADFVVYFVKMSAPSSWSRSEGILPIMRHVAVAFCCRKLAWMSSSEFGCGWRFWIMWESTWCSREGTRMVEYHNLKFVRVSCSNWNVMWMLMFRGCMMGNRRLRSAVRAHNLWQSEFVAYSPRNPVSGAPAFKQRCSRLTIAICVRFITRGST